jgi:hypothetical protein
MSATLVSGKDWKVPIIHGSKDANKFDRLSGKTHTPNLGNQNWKRI